MRLVLNLTFRAIQRRPVRTILSMLGIMIGVAGILALDITNQASMASISDLFVESSGRTDLMVIPASSTSALNSSNLRSNEMIAGVEQVLPVIKEITVLASQGTGSSFELTFFGIESGGLLLHGVDPLKEKLVRDYSITEGRFLGESFVAYEVVLVESYAVDNSLSVGDKIKVL